MNAFVLSERLLKGALIATLGVLPDLNLAAQGTVLFQNIGQGWDAPVYAAVDPDSLAPIGPLADPSFVAQLFVGRTGGSLQPVGSPVPMGAGGHFYGGVVTIPNMSPGSAPFAMVRVWRGADGTPADETIYGGVSVTFRMNPLGGNGEPPPTVFPMPSFSVLVPVPEPSTLSIFVFGLMLCISVSKYHRRAQSVTNN